GSRMARRVAPSGGIQLRGGSPAARELLPLLQSRADATGGGLRDPFHRLSGLSIPAASPRRPHTPLRRCATARPSQLLCPADATALSVRHDPYAGIVNRAPLVSVVTSAFNVAKHVRDSLGSVLAQEDVDLELVVVDDGSTDATGAI